MIFNRALITILAVFVLIFLLHASGFTQSPNLESYLDDFYLIYDFIWNLEPPLAELCTHYHLMSEEDANIAKKEAIKLLDEFKKARARLEELSPPEECKEMQTRLMNACNYFIECAELLVGVYINLEAGTQDLEAISKATYKFNTGINSAKWVAAEFNSISYQLEFERRQMEMREIIAEANNKVISRVS